MIAAISSADENLLFFLLALLAFGIALYLVVKSNWVGALVAAFIGVLILIVA